MERGNILGGVFFFFFLRAENALNMRKQTNTNISEWADK